MLTHDWFWLSCCRRTSGLKHTGTLKTIHRNRGDTKPTPNNLVVSVPEFQLIEIQCSLLSGSWVTDWLLVAPRRHRKQGPAGARPAFPQSQAASEPTTMKNQPGTMKNQLSHNHNLLQNPPASWSTRQLSQPAPDHQGSYWGGHVPVILVLVPMVMVLANHGRFFHIYLLMVVVMVVLVVLVLWRQGKESLRRRVHCS